MYKIALIGLMCLTVVLAYPANFVFEDPVNGGELYVIPVANHRIKRQNTASIGSAGTSFSRTHNLYNNGPHKVDGTYFGSKTNGGPLTAGGKLDYTNRNVGSGFVSASNTRGAGSDVGIGASYNLYRSKNGLTTADLTAQANRRFGGAGASTNYVGFLNFNHKFQ